MVRNYDMLVPLEICIDYIGCVSYCPCYGYAAVLLVYPETCGSLDDATGSCIDTLQVYSVELY